MTTKENDYVTRSRPAHRLRLLWRQEDGASTVVGEVMMVAVMVGLASVLGGLIVQGDGPHDNRLASLTPYVWCGANGWNTGDERLVIEHSGGEDLEEQATDIQMWIGGNRSVFGPGGIGYGFAIDGRLTLGERWFAPEANLGPGADVTVWVVHRNSDGSRNTIELRPVFDRRCGGGSLGAAGSPSGSGGGPTPFYDANCNGVQDPGESAFDINLITDDGYHESSQGITVPSAVGPLNLTYFELVSHGCGIILDVDATSAAEIILRTTRAGAFIDTRDQQLVSAGATEMHSDGAGGELRIDGASIEADDAVVLRTNNGFISGNGLIVAAGVPAPGGGAPAPPPPPQSGTGSIRVCNVIIDRDQRVNTGWQHPGTQFTEAGIPPFTPDPGLAGLMPLTQWTTPLALNFDVLFGDGTMDAHCVVYNNLALGGWYYYDALINPNPGGLWDLPRFNDQHQVAVATLSEFLEFSPELFDLDPANDGERNSNSDGHIVLSSSRPYRTVIMLNQFNDVARRQVEIESQGGAIDLDDSEILSHDGDVRIASSGGRIDFNRAYVESRGRESVAELRPGNGGVVAASEAEIFSFDGQVFIGGAVAGNIELPNSDIQAARNVRIVGALSNAATIIDLAGARIESTSADVILETNHLRTVNVAGASFFDRDNDLCDGVAGMGGFEEAEVKPAVPTGGSQYANLQGIPAAGVLRDWFDIAVVSGGLCPGNVAVYP